MKHRVTLLFVLLIAILVPGISQEQAFYFIMLSDPQLGMYALNRDFAQETANYEFAMATVNRLKPGFVIVLGDLVNKASDAEQIREYKRISAKIDLSIPLYQVAGNHDVGEEPTPETLAAYRKNFGRDYYSFRAGPIYGIVLDSPLIRAPKNAMAEYQEQDSWLKKELETAKASGVPHIILFMHHPPFIRDAQEPGQWANIPLERRQPMLSLLHGYDIRYVFAAHIHRNAIAHDGILEIVASGPLARPFGEEGSGIRVAAITASGLVHRYFQFGMLPENLAVVLKSR